jgi:hypothetical protein
MTTMELNRGNIEGISDLNVGLMTIHQTATERKRDLEENDQAKKVVEDLISIDEQREINLRELNISQKRWGVARNVGIVLTVSVVVLGFIGELIAEIIDDGENRPATKKWTIAIVCVVGFFSILGSISSIFTQCIFKKRLTKYKALLDLTEQDKASLQKLRTVVQGIGKLKKVQVQEDQENQQKLDRELDRIFDALKNFPDEIMHVKMPSPEWWVSEMVLVIPANHPIRICVNKIIGYSDENYEPRRVEASLTLSSGEQLGPFRDTGQKDMGSSSSPSLEPYSKGESKVQINEQWQYLTILTGLRLSGLTVRQNEKTVLLQNPSRRLYKVQEDALAFAKMQDRLEV